MITRELDTRHFPEPIKCPACGQSAAFQLSAHHLACTSQECDPSGTMWSLLDRVYRMLASQANAET
jgi:hypothetical protein